MISHRRPGRPAGPTQGRGHRPYDPRRSTHKRLAIIRAIHENQEALDEGSLTLCDLAAEIGTSISYISIVKNSAWGQEQLRALGSIEAMGR